MNSSVAVDVNYLSLVGLTAPIAQPSFTGVDPTPYSTLLKISDGCHDLVLDNLVVPQGSETAVDLDISSNVHLSGVFGGGPVAGENVLRFKGGDTNCSVSGQLIGHGTRNGVDIEVGNWMDQTYALTRGIDLTGLARNDDGSKNSVAVGWAVPFTTKLGPNCSYMFWASAGIKAYVLAKFVIRFFLHISEGEKGPSWF